MAEASPNVTEHQEDEGREELSPSQVAELSGAREETPIYGGQALMEGVMMRSPRFVAAAVRREDGEIIIKREPLKSPGQKPKIMKLPLVRGVFALWDAFSVGLRYLTFSGDVLMAEAQQQESIKFEEDEVTFEDVGERAVTATHVPTGLSVHADREKTREANRKRAERILRGKVVRHREGQEAGGIEEHETAGDDGPEQADTREQTEQPGDPTPGGNGKPQSLPASKPSSGGGTTLAMYGTMAVAFAIALVVFLWTPHAIAYWFTGSALGLFDTSVAEEAIPAGPNAVLNVLEGLIRLAFFFAYVLAIGQMPDIRRVFQYHGAEHKVVHGVEGEADLSVEGVKHYSTIHPRCGTNFVAIAICVAIILLSFMNFDQPLLRFGIRLAVIPIVAAIAYEILRLAGRYCHTPIMRVVIAPGAFLQRITTREPDEDQIEVSLTAMKEVVALESRGGL